VILGENFPDFDTKTNNVINEIFATISEIVDILKIIDPCKASGPDKISHKMLKISLPTRGIFTLTERFIKNNLLWDGYLFRGNF
jgi:hypothetical protein